MVNYKLATRAFFLLLLALSTTMPCWASVVEIEYDLTDLPRAKWGHISLKLKKGPVETPVMINLKEELVGGDGRIVQTGKYGIEDFSISVLDHTGMPKVLDLKCKTESNADVKTIDLPIKKLTAHFDLKYSIQTKKVDCLLSYRPIE